MRKVTIGLAIGATLAAAPALATEKAQPEVRRPKGGAEVQQTKRVMKGTPVNASSGTGETQVDTSSKKAPRAKKSPFPKK